MAQIDDHLHEGAASFVDLNIIDEGLINLEGIERNAFQGSERWIADAEVIDGRHEADFAELHNHVADVDGVLGGDGFG